MLDKFFLWYFISFHTSLFVPFLFSGYCPMIIPFYLQTSVDSFQREGFRDHADAERCNQAGPVCPGRHSGTMLLCHSTFSINLPMTPAGMLNCTSNVANAKFDSCVISFQRKWASISVEASYKVRPYAFQRDQHLASVTFEVNFHVPSKYVSVEFF